MRDPALRAARTVLLMVAVVLIGYLVLLARRPSATLPKPLNWFGEPAEWRTIAIVIGAIALLCVLSYRSRRNRSSATVPVMIVVGLTATSFVLSFSSFWTCLNQSHPTFFTSLIWSASLVKGGVGDEYLAGKLCPTSPPAALDVARLTIIGAIFISLLGVATAVFQSQSDRLRVSLARTVTAVVEVDDDGLSMIRAIARTKRRGSSLVLLTDNSERACIVESRSQGARIITVDLNRAETFGTQGLWRKLDRLYLLSADPVTNLSRLAIITERLAAIGTKERIPLIVRIDDPWLAEAWRAQQFGGSDNRWAADAVGKYEVTAQRLLDRIIQTTSVERVLVCGTSRLTLALCADMARRHTEREFYRPPGESELPNLVLVDPDAAEFKKDHQLHQRQRGFGGSGPEIGVLAEVPSVHLLDGLLREHETRSRASNAVIFVDVNRDADQTIATRLAGRFPAMPIYTWDPEALVSGETGPITGRLHTYRLRMDLPDGHADHFECAAMLIHERYSAGTARDQPATLPWAQLSDFFKGSNYRQLQNALWMVEQIAGHTWNTWDSPPDPLSPSSLENLEPIEQLRLLGFTDEAIDAMTRAEYEDWYRYYARDGWTYGEVRNYEKKKHDRMVSWAETKADPAKLKKATESLAGTLIQLRQLGYRSRPMWQTYRRVLIVTAKRRRRPWTWTTKSGKTIRAAAGDWEVRGDNESWPVRNDVFHKSYQKESRHRWQRTGLVLARSAHAGEVIRTPEGPVTAVNGDWVVQGERGEHWLVPDSEFKRRYQKSVPLPEAPQRATPSADDASLSND